MYETIKIDDRCLTGKLVIGKEDIIGLLPEEIREKIDAAYVYVDIGKPHWILFLSGDVGGYQYRLFSHEMEYNPYVKLKAYEPIFFWHKASYLRNIYGSNGTTKRVYAIYICRPSRMYLLLEVKQYWKEKEKARKDKTKWFAAFK